MSLRDWNHIEVMTRPGIELYISVDLIINQENFSWPTFNPLFIVLGLHFRCTLNVYCKTVT